MNYRYLPETTAYVQIAQHSWQLGTIQGKVTAAEYQWQFQWRFRERKLLVKPSLGRALIQEPLERFLERSDYQLEPGRDYTFTVRTKM